jgi:hypothetical protein
MKYSNSINWITNEVGKKVFPALISADVRIDLDDSPTATTIEEEK